MSIESKIHSYAENQKRLLELELRSEQDENEIANKEEEGRSTRVLTNLEVDYLEVGLMGRTVVHFIPIAESIVGGNSESAGDGNLQSKTKKSPLLPAHRLTVGDEIEIVTKLSQATKLNEASSSGRNKGGVVSAVTDISISVSLFENNKRGGGRVDKKTSKGNGTIFSSGDDESDLVGAGPLSLVPRSSAEVHKKLVKSLDRLEKEGADHPYAGRVIRDIFHGEKGQKVPTPNIEITPFNQNLDSSQIDAIRFALFGNQPVSLIHGPPGTGKTTTIGELIKQAVHVHKMRVLVAAPSNVAVDNVLERLVASQNEIPSKKKRGENAEKKIRAVRLGHPARIQPSIIHYSLEFLVQNSDGTEIVKDIRAEMKAHLQVASNPKTRGLERRAAYREIKTLRKEIRQREEKVVENLLTNAQVVLCTNVGAGSYLLDRLEKTKPFDLVIIDEAAQALEVSCFAPIFRGKRVVLAGDHCQLPPTIKSRHSEVQRELGKTLFERMMQRGEIVSRMLEIQYRMHQDISDWASKYMYNGKLQSHDSVKARKLSHLSYILSEDELKCDSTSLISTTMNATLLLVDTAGCDLHESVNGAGSKYNEGEAKIVSKHVRNLIHIGMKPQDIAVITPYNGQVEILRRLLLEDYPKLEIRSVDGFQGGEREAVVLSLVRSSDRGKDGNGFLKDKRRLNVAVTRAKRQVAVICDCDTVSQNGFLKDLVTWLEDKGEYLSAMEYIEEDKVVSKDALPSSVLEAIEMTTAEVKEEAPSVDTEQKDRNRVNMKSDVVQRDFSNDEISSAKQDLAERLNFFAEIADDGEEMAMDILASAVLIEHLNVICSQIALELRLGECLGKAYQATVIKAGINRETNTADRFKETQDAIVQFVETSTREEEYTLPMTADIDLVRLHSACETLGLQCLSEPGQFIIRHKPNMDAGSEEKGECTGRIADNFCHDEELEEGVQVEKSKKETEGEGGESVKPVKEKKVIIKEEQGDVDSNDGSKSINNLLGNLAKERAARQKKSEPPKQVESKKKMSKSFKPGKKLGKAAPKAKTDTKQDDALDDMDDFAFLDAQIEKVQTSHGRKVEAGGSKYKSIVNGILLTIPKPQEKRRDPRAASSLSSKLKQAEESRRAKPKKK